MHFIFCLWTSRMHLWDAEFYSRIRNDFPWIWGKLVVTSLFFFFPSLVRKKEKKRSRVAANCWRCQERNIKVFYLKSSNPQYGILRLAKVSAELNMARWLNLPYRVLFITIYRWTMDVMQRCTIHSQKDPTKLVEINWVKKQVSSTVQLSDV